MKNILFLMAHLCVISLFGQGTETFANVSLTASYLDGDFDGNNGIKWNYVHCRNVTSVAVTTSSLEKMSLPAILLKEENNGSAVYAMSGINGVGPTKNKLYKAYASTILRQIDLYVNAILVGTSPGFNDDEEHIYLVSDINVFGNVKLKLRIQNLLKLLLTI